MQMCGPRSDPIQMRQLVPPKGSEEISSTPVGATVSSPNCQLTKCTHFIRRSKCHFLWQLSQYHQTVSIGWCFTGVDTGLVHVHPALNLHTQSQRVTTYSTTCLATLTI